MSYKVAQPTCLTVYAVRNNIISIHVVHCNFGGFINFIFLEMHLLGAGQLNNHEEITHNK